MNSAPQERILTWVFLALVAFYVLWAALIAWHYFRIRKEALEVYEAERRRGAFPENEPFEPYERAYLKTSSLRVFIYRWLACVTATVLLPVIVWALNFVWVKIYYAIGADLVFEEGNMVHSFYLAVGSMAGLVLIAGLYARSYHVGRKNDFAKEWADERQIAHA